MLDATIHERTEGSSKTFCYFQNNFTKIALHKFEINLQLTGISQHEIWKSWLLTNWTNLRMKRRSESCKRWRPRGYKNWSKMLQRKNLVRCLKYLLKITYRKLIKPEKVFGSFYICISRGNCSFWIAFNFTRNYTFFVNTFQPSLYILTL